MLAPVARSFIKVVVKRIEAISTILRPNAGRYQPIKFRGVLRRKLFVQFPNPRTGQMRRDKIDRMIQPQTMSRPIPIVQMPKEIPFGSELVGMLPTLAARELLAHI